MLLILLLGPRTQNRLLQGTLEEKRPGPCARIHRVRDSHPRAICRCENVIRADEHPSLSQATSCNTWNLLEDPLESTFLVGLRGAAPNHVDICQQHHPPGPHISCDPRTPLKVLRPWSQRLPATVLPGQNSQRLQSDGQCLAFACVMPVTV